MLKGLTKVDFTSVVAWGSFFESHLLRQKSLARLLWLFHRSQQKNCRWMWYHTCFFFASLSRISERTIYHWFQRRWKYSIFFFLTHQSFFFRSLEYYYNKVDYLKFNSSYFRGSSGKPTTLLLPYFHYHLRAPPNLYITLWYHSEQLRLRFFNDYVRTHELLNNSFYLPRRFRFQQTIFSYRVRGRRKRLFRFLFFLILGLVDM